MIRMKLLYINHLQNEFIELYCYLCYRRLVLNKSGHFIILVLKICPSVTQTKVSSQNITMRLETKNQIFNDHSI